MQTHETDVTSLVAGLVLLGAAGVWGLVQLGVLTLSVLPVAIPVLLVVVGAIGVTASVLRSRRDASDQVF